LATLFPEFDWLAYAGIQAAALFVFVLYGSFAEWLLHKYIMHSKFIPRFPFEAHAIVHHGLFKADDSFHARTEEQFEHVTFSWFHHLMLIGIHIILYLSLEYLTGLPILIGGTIAVIAYLLAYEGIHYVFHVPGNRFFESHRWFLWLKQHHFVHHQRQFRNLNVVLPVADFVLRTRST
jgi:hypothetical protein